MKVPCSLASESKPLHIRPVSGKQSSLALFSKATRAWFDSNFSEPTQVQSKGWRSVAEGRHSLLLAPTGSGKTLAAFLWSLDQLFSKSEDERKSNGYHTVYISPLKALAYDVDKNLRAPLVGITQAAWRLQQQAPEITVDVRTGDTSPKERQRQLRKPGDILVTTPESLFLLIGSLARENFRNVQTIIVDEVHALAANKRGLHLSLSLERLCALQNSDPNSPTEPVRIGLSATVNPAQEIARYLAGSKREVHIVDTSKRPAINLSIHVPTPDMQSAGKPQDGLAFEPSPQAQEFTPHTDASFAMPNLSVDGEKDRGIWASLYPELMARIQQHQSTIIFVNSRGLCERLAARLNELADAPLVRAHHGSVSHDNRKEIENALKSGQLKGIVATSSLELGIDMGAVDFVALVESPASVAQGLQRAGRAGHQVGATSQCVIYPKFQGDVLEAFVVAEHMRQGAVEAIRVPQNALDVLAQHLIAMCCERPQSSTELYERVLWAYPYHRLPKSSFEAVLDMLSGKYPSADFAELQPRLIWDRSTDLLSPRKGTQMLSRLNVGTIPDRGLYRVQLGEDGPRIGELDEELVFEMRPGDTFVLGASTWRVEEITKDRVIASAAPGLPGRVPFWHGDGPGRPLELGKALGQTLRALETMSQSERQERFAQSHLLSAYAEQNLSNYLEQQIEATQKLPTDRRVIIERFKDELGDWRLCILSPFGSRVHGPWAMAIQHRLESHYGYELQVMYSDDGIVLRLLDGSEPPEDHNGLFEYEDLDTIITEQVGESSLFAANFRECAACALLLPKRKPNQRSPLWAQRLKSRNLLATVKRYPSFPIVLETYRHILQDRFDVPALKDILKSVQSRRIRVHHVHTDRPSPFARSLVFDYVANYIYDQDTPVAERRAQALTLDRELLRELLGTADLVGLLSESAIGTVVARLQRTEPQRRAHHPEAMHDLLRRLGELSEEELRDRISDVERLDDWINALRDRMAIVQIRIQSRPYWIAIEDIGLYRDALGVSVPAGLPSSFLDPVPDAATVLLRRYAKTHGPFASQNIQQRYGLPPGLLEPIFHILSQNDEWVAGQFVATMPAQSWCHRDVLRQIKRATLLELQSTMHALEPAAYTRFLYGWQGLKKHRGIEGLQEVLEQLEGLALPWSVWSQSVLPDRVTDFHVNQLDQLAASGWLVWWGAGALGNKDGKIVFCRREYFEHTYARYRRDIDKDTLKDESHASQDASDLSSTLFAFLERVGASFSFDILAYLKQKFPDQGPETFEEVLWDLVWCGKITNDVIQPLVSLSAKRPSHRRGFGTHRRGGRMRSQHHGSGSGSGIVSSGRWSLLPSLRLTPVDEASATASASASVSDTEILQHGCYTLVERYGLVARNIVQSEPLKGGFAGLYDTLSLMEERGHLRRGYFVEGLSSAQFSLPGAVDRMRAAVERDDEKLKRVWCLNTLDPANPYGTWFDWPAVDTESDALSPKKAQPRRVAKSWVVLVEGVLRLYYSATNHSLLTFSARDEDSLELSAALEQLFSLRLAYKRVKVLEINGVPARQSQWARLMAEMSA